MKQEARKPGKDLEGEKAGNLSAGELHRGY